MARDYAPNHALWALISGALEGAEEHLKAESVEVQAVTNFESVIRVKGTWSGVQSVRYFRVKLSEML